MARRKRCGVGDLLPFNAHLNHAGMGGAVVVKHDEFDGVHTRAVQLIRREDGATAQRAVFVDHPQVIDRFVVRAVACVDEPRFSVWKREG